MTPKYLYSSTSSIFDPLNYTSRSFLFPNCTNFVLDSFTIIRLWEQNFMTPSNCFCRPVIVSENNIKSSAQSRWPIIVSPMQIPISDIRYCSRSATYFRNKRPLQTPPWFTPISLKIAGLSIPLHFSLNMMTSSKWKHFPRNWPFVRGIHRSPVNSPHKGQWRGALMFSLICVWINGWVNNLEAGDLRRHRGHYDVNVMFSFWVKASESVNDSSTPAWPHEFIEQYITCD